MEQTNILQKPVEIVQAMDSQTSLDQHLDEQPLPVKRSRLFRIFSFLGFQKGYNVPLCKSSKSPLHIFPTDD